MPATNEETAGLSGRERPFANCLRFGGDAFFQSLQAWRCTLTIHSNPLADSYRVALVSPSTGHILAVYARNAFHLPRLAIPRWTRAAREIQEAIERTWPFEVVVTDFLERAGEIEDLVVIELRRGNSTPNPAGSFQWTSIDEIAGQDLSEQERDMLRRLITSGATGRGPFSCFGWTDKALEWAAEQVGATRADFGSRVQQFNAGPATVLIRLAHTKGNSYWFKASTGTEFHVTQALAKMAPGYLPRSVGIIPSVHAWLAENAGEELGGFLSPSALENAALRLAELQRQTEPHYDELLRLGCDDQRPKALLGKIPALVERLKVAMADSCTGGLKRLSDARLEAIGEALSKVCLRLDEIAVPHALIHNDVCAENILVREDQCVFIDWAQAAIGCPFVAFENLRIHLAQKVEDRSGLRRMTEAYEQQWRGVVAREQIHLAFQITPILAAICYAWSRSEWLTGPRKDLPESRAQARVLARLLDRITAKLPPAIKSTGCMTLFCRRADP